MNNQEVNKIENNEINTNNKSNDNSKIIIYFVCLIACISIFVVSIKLFGDKTISFSKNEEKNSGEKTNYSIEDARKESFSNLAKSYIYSVRNAVLAEELKCFSDASGWINVEDTVASDKNIYYFMVDSGEIYNDDKIKEQAQKSTYSLMDYYLKSPFENNPIIGYVLWTKVKTDKITYDYSIKIVDADKNGLNDVYAEKELGKDKVVVGKAKYEDKPKEKSGYNYYRCITKG